MTGIQPAISIQEGKMAEKKRVVIVGGVAGGASAAARCRRLSEDSEIVMFERGEYISFANCGMPYHLSGGIASRDELFVQSPERMRSRFRIDVRTLTEVKRIDRERREVFVRELKTGREERVGYDALVLSPGAEPIKPRIPGVESSRVFTLRTIPDMDRLQAALDREKGGRAVIIGGGYIGLEMAEALKSRGFEVAVVEALPGVMSTLDPEMAAFIEEHLVAKGVELRLKSAVSVIRETGEGGLELELSNGQSLKCGLAVLAVGVKPEVSLAKEAGLAIGGLGGIVVDEQMRTSDPAIYAVGDAVEVRHFLDGKAAYIPLAGPANRQGRIAADNIFGRKSVYQNTQGTSICKVFELVVGITGFNEKSLKARKIPYEKIYVHPLHHAGYYPGAEPITIKLLFSPESGKLLGAQLVGTQGVDKRLDVLAVALRAGLTVFDLEHLELGYAPPYGSAKDPVNMAGFVAANVLRGDVKICHSEQALSPLPNQMLLDVRTSGEFKRGTIPGAVHIPLDDLRDRLSELPREKELLVFCQTGLRSYLACRILSQKGFNCRNLTGGYKIFQAAAGGLKK
jgi:NADPH-dependent 2,4-dienoyl-CoA reductase/sulfur reductase-like enzyme/rhodanese-related sulfurtransferase